MVSRLFFILVIVSTSVHLYSQGFIGRSDIKNYTKRQYNAGSQNWEIKQDARGIMYFANNEGLLVFDGSYWNLYPLPNKTIMRSIEFGADKKLYTGGQDEFGYYSPDKYGRLYYTSLKKLLSKQDESFEDVWNVSSQNDDIFFQTNYKIFRYNGKKITVYPAFSSWLFLGRHQNQLIALDEKGGLLTYNNGSWLNFIDKKGLPQGFYITGIAAIGKDSSIVSTARNGIYILAGNKLSKFTLSGFNIDNQQNFTSISTTDNKIIISAYTNGVFLVNKNGIVTEHFTKAEGLQNASVRSLFLDNNQNIWLGLDNGIDYIVSNNAIRHINPPQFNDGIGYAIVMDKGALYFGLSNGVYKADMAGSAINNLQQETNFKMIGKGQTWQLTMLNGHIYVGKDDGFFEIKNDKLVPIYAGGGFWAFKPLPGKPPSSFTIAAGNYYGVRFFEQIGDGLKDTGPLKNFGESSRYLVADNGLLWVSHPYRGIYKINLKDSSVKLYTANNGLPATLDNHIFKIKNKPLAGTVNGIYEYDAKADRFIKSPEYENIFGSLSVRYLQQDSLGNVWFVHEKSVGVVDFSSNKPVIINIPELTKKILSGFENIYPLNANNTFISAENGFYNIDYQNYKKNIQPFRVYIHDVRASASYDSTVFGGYLNYVNDSISEKGDYYTSLPYKWNAFHFEYSAPLYGQQENLEYCYYLKGLEKDWSPWTKKTEKDYTNLPPGDYTFYVKARNHTINETAPTAFHFTILPPWYQTIWAYLFYVIIAGLLLYWLYKWQDKKHIKKQEQKIFAERAKHDEEQKNLQYLHEIELEKAEKEVIRLQNENLETKIGQKNSELASITMNLVQKKEFILKLKNQLSQLNKSVKGEEERAGIKKLLRILSDEEKLDDEWEQFSVHFNNVHGDFLNMLKEKYPDLKPHELKLCTYLRMNLSSKEIAQLMSISVRGVEISRYRLRKKLKVATDVNLFQFLFGLQKGK